MGWNVLLLQRHSVFGQSTLLIRSFLIYLNVSVVSKMLTFPPNFVNLMVSSSSNKLMIFDKLRILIFSFLIREKATKKHIINFLFLVVKQKSISFISWKMFLPREQQTLQEYFNGAYDFEISYCYLLIWWEKSFTKLAKKCYSFLIINLFLEYLLSPIFGSFCLYLEPITETKRFCEVLIKYPKNMIYWSSYLIYMQERRNWRPKNQRIRLRFHLKNV